MSSVHPSDTSGTPSKHSKHTPPTSPRSRETDPFLSISRAITNVKIRTGARLTALAVRQRYARSTAQQRYVYMTARTVTRILLCAAVIAFTASIFFENRSASSVVEETSRHRKRHRFSFARSNPPHGELSLNAMLRHRPPHLTTKHFETGPWVIAAVTDLDKNTCRHQDNRNAPMHESPCGKANTWVSFFKRGTFTLHRNTARISLNDFAHAEVSWLDEIQLVGHGHYELDNERHSLFGGRGMELSELEWFSGHLLTPDDHTGMLLEIMSPRGRLDPQTQDQFHGDPSKVPPSTFHRATLLDGPGNDSSSLFKAEWMAVKDDELIVGGHGRSFTQPGDGTRVKSDNPKWVKTVAKDFSVKHSDWSSNYDRLAQVAGVPFPGYLMHEAVLWSVERREWVFFPRRRSKEPFDPVENERKGWNVALIASEDFKQIKKVTIEGLDDRGLRGFSTAKFVPGTAERVVAAIRTVEIDSKTGDEKGRETSSFFSVFELPSGRILQNEVHFSMKKFEGLVFL